MQKWTLFLLFSFLLFDSALGQDRFLTLQSPDSIHGVPRFSTSLGVNMKLNGYMDIFGGLQDSETFKVGQINVFGNDDSKSLHVDMYQTQLKLATTLMLPDGQRIDALVESDFWGGNGTIRLRRAFVEMSHWQIGQNWHNFGDEVLWPNIMEWEGPPSGIWLRTPHIKYKNHFQNKQFIYEISLEAPLSDYNHFGELEPFVEEAQQFTPDLTFALKNKRSWGHIRLSSVLRYIRYRLQDHNSGFMGYGFSLSGIYTNALRRNNLQFQLVGGKGITAFMTSIAGQGYDGFPTNDGRFQATPVYGGWISYEYFFTPTLHGNIVTGYTHFSAQNLSRYLLTPEPETPEIHLDGHVQHMHYYGIINLMYDPYERMTIGLELDYGVKDLKADGYVNGTPLSRGKARDAMRISFGFMFYF